jgi:hypothetical protein
MTAARRQRPIKPGVKQVGFSRSQIPRVEALVAVGFRRLLVAVSANIGSQSSLV